jgi:hypothetical protein
MASIAISRSVEEVASLILDRDLVEQWVDGAIFPCELTFFLATCRVRKVSAIIESGRQDGFSTEILARFGQHYGVDIYSIDHEVDRERAQRCRARLHGLPVNLLKGDAYELVGRQVNALTGHPIALLVDGPKGWAALSMIAAALRPHLAVCALHNLYGDQLDWIAKFGGHRYEDRVAPDGPRWQELLRRETQHVAVTALRNNTPSTLGVIDVSEQTRGRMAHSFRTEFGLHQPDIVRLFWRLGLYHLTPRLYGLSYRLLRRVKSTC